MKFPQLTPSSLRMVSCTSPPPSLSLPRTDFMLMLVLWQFGHGESDQNIKYGRGRPYTLKRGENKDFLSLIPTKVTSEFKNKRPENSISLETDKLHT